MNLPLDIKLGEFWPYLSYSDIKSLCLTSKEFSSICHNKQVWRDLLRYDFWVDNNGNVKDLYFLYQRALNRYSKFYLIITQRALQRLVELIPESYWATLDAIIVDFLDTFDDIILSLEVFNAIINGGIDECGMNIKYGDSIYPDPNSIYQGLDKMIDKLESSDDCSEYSIFVSKPSLIFVKGVRTIIEYDYDLAQEIVCNSNGNVEDLCASKLNRLSEQIKALI